MYFDDVVDVGCVIRGQHVVHRAPCLVANFRG